MAEPARRRIRFAVIGVDHRHIYEMTGRLLELGNECVGYWTAANRSRSPASSSVIRRSRAWPTSGA